MALGKNLKRKKLIEDEKPAVKPKAAKKKTVAKKKELIKPPKAKAKAKAKRPATKKTKAQSKTAKATTRSKPSTTKSVAKTVVTPVPPKSTERVEPQQTMQMGLPIYIAEELHGLKTKLREQYENDLLELKGKRVQFVVFEVGGESYAVDISVVKEVVPVPVLSKTPNTPDHIRGMANIRGTTYTVFDLAKKFKVVGDQIAKFLLVIAGNDVPASIMIGDLPVTFKIDGDKISSSMDMVEAASLDVSYIKGIIQHDEKLIYYLDIVELLKNDKAIVVPDKFTKGGK